MQQHAYIQVRLFAETEFFAHVSHGYFLGSSYDHCAIDVGTSQVLDNADVFIRRSWGRYNKNNL
jgi:hypothetical protein